MKTTVLLQAACAAAAIMLCGGAASNDPPPQWAFIIMHKGPDLPKDKPVTVAGSKLIVPPKEFEKNNYVADWFPSDHPKMPIVVEHGRPAQKVSACSECHMVTGVGGPDSAVLAGLPADYIVEQFEEFHSGRRGCAVKESEPCAIAMPEEAKAISAADIRAAAEYFAKTPYRSRLHVVEAAMVPKVEMVWYNYMPVKGTKLEPIGDRIVEVASDLGRYMSSDWHAPITAYVPPGSLKRGKALVDSGAGAVPCAACHGAGMQGVGMIPPLAGRSPSYLYRQLYNIQYGYRKGPAVALMLPEVAHLTAKDRLAIAAYLASMGSEKVAAR